VQRDAQVVERDAVRWIALGDFVVGPDRRRPIFGLDRLDRFVLSMDGGGVENCSRAEFGDALRRAIER
jgi:hypothetical protein